MASDDSGRQDDSERRVLSRKELAKEMRRAAYKKAKEQRAQDPRHLAMKEAAKVRRREAYQKIKEQRKAALAVEKTKLKAEQTAERAVKRAESNNELWKLITWITKGSSAKN
jgi:hypothetical protein